MTMVIIQFVIPIMAVLGLQWLLYREKSRELLKADFKKILYTIGGLFVFFIADVFNDGLQCSVRSADTKL